MLFKLSSHEGKSPGVSVMRYLTINLAAVLSHIIGFLERFAFKSATNNIHYNMKEICFQTLQRFVCSISDGNNTANKFKTCCYKAPYSHVKVYICYLFCVKRRSSLFVWGLILKRFFSLSVGNIKALQGCLIKQLQHAFCREIIFVKVKKAAIFWILPRAP